jgi:hypothetical protein
MGAVATANTTEQTANGVWKLIGNGIKPFD